MTFIDWSDSEGIFGLLIEFIADEKSESVEDIDRTQFLTELLADLNSINEGVNAITPAEAIKRLKAIHNSINPEFKGDPVVVHIADCIEELKNVH